MQDYSKLVAALRCRTTRDWTNCGNCKYADEDDDPRGCWGTKICADAADAIEALQANVADKDHLIQEQTDEIQRLRADVKRQQEKMIELAKKLPKRGEWELIDGAEPMRWGCSRCKYLSWETSSYCPRCGAKMEVQDGANRGF